MNAPIFQFSNVVVVDGDKIGVIVKTWGASNLRETHYDVYVRSYNGIKEYDESQIRHYVYSKHLAEDEREFYS